MFLGDSNFYIHQKYSASTIVSLNFLSYEGKDKIVRQLVTRVGALTVLEMNFAAWEE